VSPSGGRQHRNRTTQVYSGKNNDRTPRRRRIRRTRTGRDAGRRARSCDHARDATVAHTSGRAATCGSRDHLRGCRPRGRAGGAVACALLWVQPATEVRAARLKRSSVAWPAPRPYDRAKRAYAQGIPARRRPRTVPSARRHPACVRRPGRPQAGDSNRGLRGTPNRSPADAVPTPATTLDAVGDEYFEFAYGLADSRRAGAAALRDS
jgi:hypothetical protein